MPTQEERALAKKLEASLKKNHEATVQDLAAEHEAPESMVIKVLNEFYVEDDGSIVHKGEGAGGGWNAARVAEAQRQEAAEAAAEAAQENGSGG